MKSFFRYRRLGELEMVPLQFSSHRNVENREAEVGWFLLTSSNLSQAAWGVLQGKGSKLFIKSFEMGVLFLPSRLKRKHRRFSCTPSHPLLGGCKINDDAANHGHQCFTVQCKESCVSSTQEGIRLPIPFLLPPTRYSEGDAPWVWDRAYDRPDYLGNVFPRP